MINRNHFQFDRKIFFNFWKTIYDFENCKSFFGFQLIILLRMFVGIRYHRTLEFVSNPTLPLKILEL